MERIAIYLGMGDEELRPWYITANGTGMMKGRRK